MGGKAMKLHGIETERKNTSEHLRIQAELIPVISEMFKTEVKGVKFYHTKETHGDCDLLILNHGNLGNVAKILEAKFGVIHNNNGVYSFAYDNYQVDIIPQPTRNWNCCADFFDYDPTGNLMGKTAHKFGLKYGFEGLVYPFRTFSGQHSEDIVVSKNSREIFTFLGFDYDRYLQGFDTLEEIFEWVINSVYFSSEMFLMENLNSIDRKRNKKRATYQKFLEYLNQKTSSVDFPFFKDKSLYLEIIDARFPEANLKEQLDIIKEKDEVNKLVASKFNGELVMEWTGLKDKELGLCITNFKKHIESTHNVNFKQWVLGANVKEEFMALYSAL